MSIVSGFTIASVIINGLVAHCLRLSGVYSRYITSRTPLQLNGMSAEESARVRALFEGDEDILQPVPGARRGVGGGARAAVAAAAP